MATIAKLLWNIHAKSDKLWVKWIHMYFIKGASIMDFQPGNSCSWIVKNIFKHREDIINSRSWAVVLAVASLKLVICIGSYEVLSSVYIGGRCFIAA